ncbi:hypothetical protein EMIHUDRAFT_201456 [Emiliania huxleyi CCMP1516]|uniref:Ankyrin repeat protein n=2 Tax=Emiliania huxleyi TaxID=2903 RepID=A0A0D3KI12_EMIH1|nr:hypothetical protein EMIHUDRAFT_201456 [Emiliania huxleyi CCMP1516]EOD35397.1 hypothetical protein EMIHUDRAFT_201456 [Emiliania huxleyi CCMP1516]|eukprot:XP_005787826.1 hypothetical protein EMIHUDRAFT_201456 [Emiliania huxleyi CCMP1516]
MRRVATINLAQDHSEYSNDNKDVRGGGICAPSDVKEMDETEFLNGCRLLHAVARNDTSAVRALLASGCSVNFRDYDRRTALHVAHAALARELVLSGARAHRLDRWGGTCLDDALRHRHALIAEWLRTEVGMKVTGPSDPVGKGDLAEVRTLVESDGIDVDRAAFDGRTALHLAASEGRAEVEGVAEGR